MFSQFTDTFIRKSERGGIYVGKLLVELQRWDVCREVAGGVAELGRM